MFGEQSYRLLLVRAGIFQRHNGGILDDLVAGGGNIFRRRNIVDSQFFSTCFAVSVAARVKTT
jgi:hypothetical protein